MEKEYKTEEDIKNKLKVLKDSEMCGAECNRDSVEKCIPTSEQVQNIKTINENETLQHMNFIGVDDAFCYFKSLNIPQGSNFEIGYAARVRWKGFINWINAPPKLKPDLKKEYDLICAIARLSFDWDDVIHCQMVHTVYKRLTGTDQDCPQLGSHWQLIGFQGSDPSTDLRGVGLLGLLQLLYLSSDSLAQPLAQKLYKVSNSENQPFPLAVLSLNVTQIVLNALHTGKLNRECNCRESVLHVVNNLYLAVTNYIFKIWVSEEKTIKDSGYLLKDAEKYCWKNVRKLLQELHEQMQNHNK